MSHGKLNNSKKIISSILVTSTILGTSTSAFAGFGIPLPGFNGSGNSHTNSSNIGNSNSQELVPTSQFGQLGIGGAANDSPQSQNYSQAIIRGAINACGNNNGISAQTLMQNVEQFQNAIIPFVRVGQQISSSGTTGTQSYENASNSRGDNGKNSNSESETRIIKKQDNSQPEANSQATPVKNPKTNSEDSGSFGSSDRRDSDSSNSNPNSSRNISPVKDSANDNGEKAIKSLDNFKKIIKAKKDLNSRKSQINQQENKNVAKESGSEDAVVTGFSSHVITPYTTNPGLYKKGLADELNKESNSTYDDGVNTESKNNSKSKKTKSKKSKNSGSTPGSKVSSKQEIISSDDSLKLASKEATHTAQEDNSNNQTQEVNSHYKPKPLYPQSRLSNKNFEKTTSNKRREKLLKAYHSNNDNRQELNKSNVSKYKDESDNAYPLLNQQADRSNIKTSNRKISTRPASRKNKGVTEEIGGEDAVVTGFSSDKLTPYTANHWIYEKNIPGKLNRKAKKVVDAGFNQDSKQNSNKKTKAKKHRNKNNDINLDYIPSGGEISSSWDSKSNIENSNNPRTPLNQPSQANNHIDSDNGSSSNEEISYGKYLGYGTTAAGAAYGGYNYFASGENHYDTPDNNETIDPELGSNDKTQSESFNLKPRAIAMKLETWDDKGNKIEEKMKTADEVENIANNFDLDYSEAENIIYSKNLHKVKMVVSSEDGSPVDIQYTGEENKISDIVKKAYTFDAWVEHFQAKAAKETSEGGAQATNEQQEASEGDAGIAGAAAAGYENGHETSGEDGHAASDSGIKPSGPTTKVMLQEVGNFDDSINDLLTDRLKETGGARRALASKSQPSSGISTGSGLYPETNIWAKAFMRGSYINNDSNRDSLLGGAIIGIDNEVTDDITGGVAFQIGGGKSNKAGEKDASLFAVGGLLYERANIGENLSNNLSFQFSRNSISPENAEASDGQVIWNFRPTLGFDYDYSYGDFDISGGLSLYGQSRIAEENSHKTALKLDLETSYNINSGDYNVKPYLAVGGEWSFWESNAKSDEQLPEASKISPVSDDSLVGGFSSGVKLDNDNYSLQLNYSYNKGWNKVFSSHTGAIKLSVKL